jgi:hypothetical protein
VTARLDDDVCDPQRQGALGPGVDGDPLIGLCGSHGGARLDLHDLGPLAGATTAHARVGAQMARQRLPCLEESATKAEQVVGSLPVIGSVVAPALSESMRQRCPVCALLGTAHVVGRAKGAAETGDEIARRPALAIVEKDHPLRMPGVAQRPERDSDLLQRLLPRHRLPPAANPLHGALGAIGVVEHMKASLAPWAESALVVGMKGIAVELDQATVHHAGGEPAPCRTEPASAQRATFLRGGEGLFI